MHIEDHDGNEVLNFEPPKSFNSIAFSSSELVSGSSYYIYLGGSHSGTAMDGVYEDGSYEDGSYIKASNYSSFTVSGTVCYVN